MAIFSDRIRLMLMIKDEHPMGASLF